ncbi:hypothetical protein ACFOX0_21290 [Micromonospora zhanjiangensis]|uniref:Transposase DDE domain-containing protein n=1 Tax=Micromonospora zhanjiangensis TaxID=1522057 RepID=A0ABV8KQM1_9ACTN
MILSTRSSRRLLFRARYGRPARRLSHDEYVLAVAFNLARLHRPVWSLRRWRRVCRCGADLPCRSRYLVPVNHGHWPSQGSQR